MTFSVNVGSRQTIIRCLMMQATLYRVMFKQGSRREAICKMLPTVAVPLMDPALVTEYVCQFQQDPIHAQPDMFADALLNSQEQAVSSNLSK